MEKAADNNRALTVARPMGLKLCGNHKYEKQVCSSVTIVVQLGIRSVLVCTPSILNSLIHGPGTPQIVFA